MPVVTFPLGPLETNSYLLTKAGKALAIDVGGDPAEMLDYLQNQNLSLLGILITHLHFDHLYGVAKLAKMTKAPIYTPPLDASIKNSEASKGGIWGFPLVEAFSGQDLEEGKQNLGEFDFLVLHTPGHTPGSLSFYFPSEQVVFTGDALFYRSVGRTDFPGGSAEDLASSIKNKLFSLPEATIVYPGHGSETSIGAEKLHNPYLGQQA
ncbi:MAG: MBL fold metallo-hydrolase [Desulfovibrio sp.]|nr:MBL fold metallo-hydrolase [Desulfovibrio sp.]